MLPKFDWSDVIEEIIGGLIVLAIAAIATWFLSEKVRLFLKRLLGAVMILSGTAMRWLAKQWRYLVVIFLLSLTEAALYRVYADWKVIAFSLAHFTLIAVAIWLLTPKERIERIGGAPYAFVQNFRFDRSGWTTPSSWFPKSDERGLNLVPHEYLSKVFIIEKLPVFADGEIECEVYLEQNALFDVIVRGSLAEDEWYMARLDARPIKWDCILFKPKGQRWEECNKDALEHHSPHSQWLTMRVVADGPRVSLYRDGLLVDRITDAKLADGRISLFAEVANVYVRKISVSPASA